MHGNISNSEDIFTISDISGLTCVDSFGEYFIEFVGMMLVFILVGNVWMILVLILLILYW